MNSDGVLDARTGLRGEAMFARADTNGDGELTIANAGRPRSAQGRTPELRRPAERAERRGKRGGDRSERMAERFAAADADNSGGLSQSAEGDAECAANAGGQGRRGMRMLERVDTNGDKAIGRAELMPRHGSLPPRQNADGAISAAERDAAKAERKQRRERRGR